jgi:hypothetical protein
MSDGWAREAVVVLVMKERPLLLMRLRQKLGIDGEIVRVVVFWGIPELGRPCGWLEGGHVAR